MLIKRSQAVKYLLPFYFLIFLGAILVIFWFTSSSKQRKMVIVTGSFYITSPQDTLIALPQFDKFLRQVNPDLIIVEELFTPSLNLAILLHPDSLPVWSEQVTAAFQQIMENVKERLAFEVKFLNPWRMDILNARRQFWSTVDTSRELKEKLQFYSLIHKTSTEVLSIDTVLANPLSMNTETFDRIMQFQTSLFNKMFNDALGSGKLEVYNERFLNNVKSSLNSTNARKILILCNALNKYWLIKNLAPLSEIKIGQIPSISKKAKRL